MTNPKTENQSVLESLLQDESLSDRQRQIVKATLENVKHDLRPKGGHKP